MSAVDGVGSASENLAHVLLEPCMECCGRGWVRDMRFDVMSGRAIQCPRCHGSGNEE